MTETEDEALTPPPLEWTYGEDQSSPSRSGTMATTAWHITPWISRANTEP